MNTGYTGSLGDGREVYIPHWPVTVSLENLTKAGKILGASNIVNIAKPDTAAVIVALMSTEESEQAAALIRHFCCQARIDGERITHESYNEQFAGDGLTEAAELFSLVVHAQYSDFFERGLAKALSQALTQGKQKEES